MIKRILLTGAALFIGGMLNGADTAPHFNRDIRPILAEHCFHCHGPDPSSHKAGLRFDREESLFVGRGAQIAAVVRGKPDESPLYQRISAVDPEELMPPESAHKPLSSQQIARIRAWIAAGAPWAPHWSLVAPVRPPLPNGVTNGAASIDWFVHQRLAQDGLQPAAAADRHALIRRVTLDLTGLPPAPAAVAAFMADATPHAYERVVDGLLASARYGEHRARYWLDAARYADTHGLHYDNYREMWAYRDWVIAAFNADQPFDRFTIEQIAGDLLPQPTRAQVIATGFHRCAMTTNEDGTIEAENLAMYARERVETTSWVWLGLTANCAVCHDHKFDPLPTRDFYAFSAFFRNTTQNALDGNVKDSAPVAVVPKSPADEAHLQVLHAQLAVLQQTIASRREMLRGDLESWINTQAPIQLRAADEVPVLHLPLTDPTPGTVLTGSNAAGQALRARAVMPVRAWDDAPVGKAPRLHEEDDVSLEEGPDFGRNTPYTMACWIMLPATSTAGGAVFSRMDDGDGYRGWDLWVQRDQFAAHVIHRWPEDALKVHTRGGLKRGTWQHVCVAYDGSGTAAGLKIFIDGTAVALGVEADSLQTASLTTAPFKLARRKHGAGLATVTLQDVRIYAKRLPDESIVHLARAARFALAMHKPAAERTAADHEVLLDLRALGDEPLRQARAASIRIEAERTVIGHRSAVTHVMQERTDAAAVAYVLNRGQYDQPGEQVEAGVFTALPALPATAPRNRLGLAHWLVAPENPLTARVTVNRLWQEFFGTGLVRTTEDFGIMGDAPSHPELLDWLAVEFRESGWKMKALIRTIVCSATYRQAAVATPEKLEKDPANRLLSRGPRFRMDAEMVRDTALSVAGVLSPISGGPSVRPYQPAGVWESVGMQESDTHRYQRDQGESLYRRSLYTFWKRQAPPAAMEVFNAPSRETACVRRDRTNTPLQALVTLNDEQFIEAARLLAARILAAGGDDQQQLQAVAGWVLSREFTAEEITVVQGSLIRLRAHYRASPAAVTALLAIGATRSSTTLDQTELAALTMMCNQVLNLDEALCK